MLQQKNPEDFVLATGVTTTIKDFLIISFKELGVEIAFRGENEFEEGFVVVNNGIYKIAIGQLVVKVDSKHYRPTEVDLLIGDASKAKNKLGWNPKYDLKSLVREMIQFDLELFKKQLN